MKRVLSVLLALCLLVGALPMFASAADDWERDQYGTLVYVGPGGDVVIPEGETGITGAMFSNEASSKITSLTLPSTANAISIHAFDNCTSMTSVRIPAGIQSIGGSCFPDCVKDIYYEGTKEQWLSLDTYFDYTTKIIDKVHFEGDSGNEPNPPITTVGGFTDVKSSDYYADAVVWAVENSITNGIGSGKFGPSQACKREQIVTFLWNSTGKPEPGSIADFKDMPKNETYQKSVSWAVENGITYGYAGNTFRPGKTCTRAEAMTFIWRAHNCPEPSSMASFTDMPSIPDYQKAISWASENGITSGIGGNRFGPDQTCTRGQIVTFLYNARNL